MSEDEEGSAEGCGCAGDHSLSTSAQFPELDSQGLPTGRVVRLSKQVIDQINSATLTSDEFGRNLYQGYVDSLDPHTVYQLPEFNLGLREYVRQYSDNPLVLDAAFDAKEDQMFKDCKGVMPQHSSL